MSGGHFLKKSQQFSWNEVWLPFLFLSIMPRTRRCRANTRVQSNLMVGLTDLILHNSPSSPSLPFLTFSYIDFLTYHKSPFHLPFLLFLSSFLFRLISFFLKSPFKPFPIQPSSSSYTHKWEGSITSLINEEMMAICRWSFNLWHVLLVNIVAYAFHSNGLTVVVLTLPTTLVILSMMFIMTSMEPGRRREAGRGYTFTGTHMA